VFAEDILMEPTTCNASCGAVVPTPTRPPSGTRKTLLLEPLFDVKNTAALLLFAAVILKCLSETVE
jgi:hypothetical protein